MDAKTIEMVDKVVDGYNKVKSLFQENTEMFRNLKKWFKDHKVVIFVVLFVLVAVGYFIYRQYQLSKQKVNSKSGKTKQKTDLVEDPDLNELDPDPDNFVLIPGT